LMSSGIGQQVAELGNGFLRLVQMPRGSRNVA